MTVRPEPDLLSEVAAAVRLSGAVFFDVEARAPWVAEAPPGKLLAPHVMPNAEHVLEYHVVTEGHCYAGVIGEPPIRLDTGDVIVFPQGDAHVVSSAPNMRGTSSEPFHIAPDTQLPIAMSHGSGELQAKLYCGFIGCDARPFNPLISALPRVLHLPKQDEWIAQVAKIAVVETVARSPGRDGMLARLSEMLFISAVRHFLATLPDNASSWLAGLRDDAIGRALRLLHDRVAHDWSLEELAKEVAMSRTVLAERFQHFVGQPPMRYLARWRMQLASSLLSEGKLSFAEIADRIGYGSETAFSRAFKREVGMAPALWRDR